MDPASNRRNLHLLRRVALHGHAQFGLFGCGKVHPCLRHLLEIHGCPAGHALARSGRASRSPGGGPIRHCGKTVTIPAAIGHADRND
jgi:hypothetical protein